MLHTYAHWLAAPDKSGQVVHFAVLLPHSLCPSADGQISVVMDKCKNNPNSKNQITNKA